MQDPRIPQLARQLVRYSTTVKRGENVLIDIHDAPDELAIAAIRQANHETTAWVEQIRASQAQ